MLGIIGKIDVANLLCIFWNKFGIIVKIKNKDKHDFVE